MLIVDGSVRGSSSMSLWGWPLMPDECIMNSWISRHGELVHEPAWILQLMSAASVMALAPSCNRNSLVMGTLPGATELASIPGKNGDDSAHDRPPQLETPIHYFRQDLTPNEAFFVRWHLEGIPTSVDLRTFRLNISGHVQQSLQLSMDDLHSQFEQLQSSLLINAPAILVVSSSLAFQVVSGSMAQSAMQNGPVLPLKSILDRAQVKAGAVDVSFNGLDVPPLPSVADFVKALSIDHARDGEVMIAYAMNDQPLPMVNGFPLRLVVPDGMELIG